MKYDEQADLRVISQHSRQALAGREHERVQFDELLAEMESTISALFRRDVETPASITTEPVENNPQGPRAQPSAAPTELIEPVAESVPLTRQERSVSPVPASAEIGKIIEGDVGPIKAREPTSGGNGKGVVDNGGGSGFHQRVTAISFSDSFKNGVNAVRRNLIIAMGFTIFLNILVLAIPIYLFQISDRVLTSRSTDTLVMLTLVIVGAVIVQVILDAIRRFILMRTAVEVAVQLGAPILSAAARASLHGNGKDYQVLGDLQQLRSFLTSGTLLSFFDAPIAPIFVLAVFLVHPHLGYIVVISSLLLIGIAFINQRATAASFAEATSFQSRAMLHLDSMSRNSQIINALAMIPEAVRIWGRDMAGSLRSQVKAQDRNIVFATLSKCSRLLTQVTMLGWGAHLAIDGQMTGGMVVAASIIAGRALAPIEGAIEGWNSFIQFRSAFGRIRNLLQNSPLNFERLRLPDPQGRLDVERILYVPPPNKKVILNGISFTLMPGESMAVIGNSGAGKTTLGKMLVGSILPTSGSVRLDLMDLRNWDQRQFGENIGYLPQDVQLFPGTIKANIARMREDVSDQSIFDAAVLADVHELIASFPQGYETMVAADGAPLSGGQKQRIALARAFFGNPTLVVLDEPNSNLDSQGDAALTKALFHAKKHNITVVTITQRPALLSCVDKIMVLNNGTVTMFGTRATVMEALSRKNKQQTPVQNIRAAE
ncbi:type I secretion system permease/ATPase [Phyllobacterium sp. LjRoot231]|uniref:type I secretion system permease/ATPase n=1 Tax=Phyllobacterium sp. LjRoot231 TaxID=3342289 RepID=UPI003ECE7882